MAELFQIIDADEEIISWRQGRSLPYGERVSFWALGEIVKAHAGILESDDTATAEQKLGARFDVKPFHAIVLGAGAVTLPVLADRVNAWINANQS